METNDQNKPNSGLPFYSLTFLVALLFELYWIFTRPYDYFMLIGIGIILIITGYLTMDSLLKIRSAELLERRQQNETMIKAQKAIYLATKKNIVEAEKGREQNLKTLELLMGSMASSQKELVNAITTNIDNTSANRIGMSDSDMGELVDKLTKSNDKLAKQVQDAITINELVKANAELVKNVQHMFGGTDSNNNVSDNVNTAILNTIPVENMAEMISHDPIIEEAENTDLDEFVPAFEDFGITEEQNADATEEIDTNDINNNDIVNEINTASMENAQTLEDMTVAEDITPELDNEMSNTTVNSDPDAPLTEEEIAALFASL